ncbi:MAG: TA system VapC family ribonuclease toxin [Acidobacteriaceae bacterium]
MAASLLDLNALIALLWAESEFHAATESWFRNNARKGWATSPLTQLGFVRVVCNPSVFRNAPHPAQALEVIEESTRHAAHEFWPHELTLAEAAAPFREHLQGHQQIADVYLLGLTLHRKGRLITFDKALLSLASAAGMGHLVTLLMK